MRSTGRARTAALAWSGLSVTGEQMVPEVYTPGREGTLPADMVSAARRHGRLAVPVGGLSGVLAEISAGHPVIVFQNLGLRVLPYWHFALAMGYDLDAGTISLHSGREAERTIGLATFERTWTRAGGWALTVVPPGILPATGSAVTIARAAVGLERAGHAAAARESYRAMVLRWPDDLAAWNNLAHVLGRRGQTAEAITAARRRPRGKQRRALPRYPERAVAVSNRPGKLLTAIRFGLTGGPRPARGMRWHRSA